MATKSINWPTGTGSITVEYDGSGDGTIQVSSDPNNLYESRSTQIVVQTTDGSNISRTVTIAQAAKVRIDISSATVSASNQTYSGSAKTPVPTVTLNGSTIPSSGYDVSYSNNTNAGTATITVTGNGEYTGTATGTFTIAKASRTLSFADTYVVLAPSSNITKTAAPSAGSGDGSITYSISSTTYATINSSSGKVTSKTSDGSAVVTATISEGTNYLSASASYNLYVFATTHNYSYTGSYQSVTLPPGSYKLQVWGAQGGSNAADSNYGITAQAGGKGGYSEGVLTVSSQTTIRAYVGGQGTSSAGGYNGGGFTGASATADYNNIKGVSKCGGGGGGTDFRLSNGSLYSRMVVAGGGSGGAMCCKQVTTYTEEFALSDNAPREYHLSGSLHLYGYIEASTSLQFNQTYKMVAPSGYSGYYIIIYRNSSGGWVDQFNANSGEEFTTTKASGSNASYIAWVFVANQKYDDIMYTSIYRKVSVPSVTTTYISQVGYAGGGTEGKGVYTSGVYFYGRQNAAGSAGGFGKGADYVETAARYHSGSGGGGWYGGGYCTSNDTENAVKWTGGGSGWVNTAASASNRPSGYTGLQLDSGETKAGDTSFPAPGGGNETGHSGDGYARITRL